MESLDLTKNRHQTPLEKLRQERYDRALTDKADSRQEFCWCEGCRNKCVSWVREVQFDIKEDKAGIDFALVSSSDYDGPVPGFCHFHAISGPPELAQAVYFSRGEMTWGFRPNRWFTIFTDGTKVGGFCVEFEAPATIIAEEHITSP
jgi:hypothetical protein